MQANKVFQSGIHVLVGGSEPNRPHPMKNNKQRLNLYFSLGFVLVILLGSTRLAFLLTHISTDPDEGWNAVHAVLAMGNGALYPRDGLIGTNYPPVSFLLVGMIGKLTGDMIFAGRLVAVCGILCTAGLVWQISLKLTRARFAASAALLLFCLYNVTLCRSYLGMDDPQWLGLSFSLLGLTLLLPPAANTKPNWQRTSLAALLFVTSGFVKQNLIGIPMAVTLWLALEERQTFMVWILASCAALTLGLGLCAYAYGSPFFHNVFLVPRRYVASRAILRSLPFLFTFLPMIFASCWLLRFQKQDVRLRLLLICVPTTLITGILQRCGVGVDINAHFETLSVLCIVSGLTIARTPRTWWWFAIPFLFLVPLSVSKAWRDIASYPQRLATFQAMEAHILSKNGPVACEDLAYCYWTGKGYQLDFFLYGQRVLATRSNKALRTAITDGKISLAEIIVPYGTMTNDSLAGQMQGWSRKTIYISGNDALIELSRQMAENKLD